MRSLLVWTSRSRQQMMCCVPPALVANLHGTPSPTRLGGARLDGQQNHHDGRSDLLRDHVAGVVEGTVRAGVDKGAVCPAADFLLGDISPAPLPPPVFPPSAALSPSPSSPVIDFPEKRSSSAAGDEGRLGASPVAPTGCIGGGRRDAEKVVDGHRQMTGEHRTGKPSMSKLTSEKPSAEAPASGEPLAKKPIRGKQSQSDDSDVVEVPVEEEKPRRSARPNNGKPPKKLSYHACLPPTANITLLDNTEDDVDLPELDPDMHADPDHLWDIANMTVKEALASWKGKAVKAAMDEEIKSLISNGTWELVERPSGVNIVKNCSVLTTKYHIDDTVSPEKACLVMKGFTPVCGAGYDETYCNPPYIRP
ncbi:unnamed protein product [Closterium sp. NIES-53]